VKNNKKNTFARKVLWLAGFVVTFVVCYIGLELLWNRFIAGSGFTVDMEKLPGEAASAVFIGAMILYINRNKKTDEENA